MRIVGIEPCSFVDWPRHIAAVLFAPGCNLDCFYCHNRHLLAEDVLPQSTKPEKVLDWLESRKGFLDGVVFSGGEPTLQRGLADFARKVRAIGYKTKLDTNGTKPDVLRSVLSEGLFDYVAMDIKASADKYDSICRCCVCQYDIDSSIGVIMDLAPDYEFRTTWVPALDAVDIFDIACRVRGAKRFVLQQYRKPDIRGAIADMRLVHTPHPPALAQDMARRLSGFVGICELRGFAGMESRVALSG